MRNKWNLRGLLALLLVAAMLLGMVGCGVEAPAQLEQSAQNKTDVQQESQKAEAVQQIIDSKDTEDLTRAEKELIINLLTDDSVHTEQMTEVQLDALVKELTAKLEEEATEDPSNDSGIYDENGAMTVPFDQAYPELVEDGTVTYDDETLLIKLSNSRNGVISEGMAAAGVAALEAIVPMETATWYEAKLVEGTDAQAAIAALRELKEVLMVEFNFQIQTAQIDEGEEHDEKRGFDHNEYYKDQWYLNHCGIPDGMDEMQTNGGSSSVIVAVIDTGVDYDHEDLAQNIWVNSGEIPGNNIDDDGNGYVDDYYGVDIVAGKGNGDDDNGHGTHVAGIIAAQNNNLGVVGIAYNVKIMSVKAAMASGTLNQSDIAKAILYAYDMGAEVINMSFGGSACSIAVQDALSVAYSRCVLVASAGNDAMPNEATDYYDALPNYPAALTYVLGVMSVDQYGVESSFTNWDAKAFNGVEYELYAPGSEIMSTLPNNRYGVLSGTSMAAPVVSAMAAILRSEFSDRDMYPTKFIYGQLCSTSGYTATCNNPEDHTVNGETHALAQIVDLHAALTKLPNPEVNLHDYSLFDTETIGENNNGDGVIDAGETFALGLTLRNRWGMSKNTIVTIDTLSGAGIADPYVTIGNPSVDYGSVGTYSTQNCGAIYTDELLTGWENPFYITISKDCPNDYIIKLNVTITCGNALDEEDTTVYRSTGEIWLYVRNGVVLPSVIDEDMVLTSDNLYIIPNATVINEGVTVRVEPGTYIQFWSSDAEDPYADEYIAYLLVRGNFLVEGTKENPVYIYPSDLMSQYNVEIAAGSNGCVSLVYADITNLAANAYGYDLNRGNTGRSNIITYAEHCTFRQNYTNIYYRHLDSGKVVNSFMSFPLMAYFMQVRNCTFYKNCGTIRGYVENSIFIDCNLTYDKVYYSDPSSFRNCVFLGNQLNGNPSDLEFYESVNVKTSTFNNWVAYNADTGTTYVRYNISSLTANIATYYALLEYVEQELGGTFCVIETADEFSYLSEQGAFSYNSNSSSTRTVMGMRKGPNDVVYWSDGTEVGDFIYREFTSYSGWQLDPIGFRGSYICYPNYTSSAGVLFEIPGIVLPTEINFANYTVELDLEQTYQLEPVSFPVPLDREYFIFESTDESVITVDENGLVTPVGTGTADVYVYYQDRAVYNYVSFTVSDYVPLEGISLTETTLTIGQGNTHQLHTVLTPADTTRTEISYTSSDETVATVDETGKITAISNGTVTVTAACDGMTVQIEVSVVDSVTALIPDTLAIYGALSDGEVLLPVVQTQGDAQTDLVWESLDERVAVIYGAKAKLLQCGTTTLRVTDRISGKSESVLLVVRENASAGIKDIYMSGNSHYVLLDNGTLYFWNNTIKEPTIVASDVKMFDANGGPFATVHTDGSIKSWSISGTTITLRNTYTDFVGQEIAGLQYGYINNTDTFWVYTTEGELYVWGYNYWGQLGTGDTETVTTPTLSSLTNVVDVRGSVSGPFILTAEGNVYTCGYQYWYYDYNTEESGNVCATTPKLLAEGVTCFVDDTNYGDENDVGDMYYEWDMVRVQCADGKIRQYGTIGDVQEINLDLSQFDQYSVNSFWESYAVPYGIAIKDGKVYKITGKDDEGNVIWSQVNGITNATCVYNYANVYYVGTQDGKLLFFGNNSTYYNNTLGESAASTVTTPVVVPLTGVADLDLRIIGSTMTADNVLKITLNKSVLTYGFNVVFDQTVNATWWGTIVNGNELHIHFEDVETATPVGVTVTLPAGSVDGVYGTTNSEDLTVTAVCPVVTHVSVLDETVQRTMTVDDALTGSAAFFAETQINGAFYGNAILNRISTDTDVNHWLRILAPSASDYTEIPLGGNYWGTTNATAIGLQIVDYTDFVSYARLMYAPYLTTAPENTFPFVTSITILNKDGEAVTTVGNEPITVRVTFNRDMDTSIPLNVRFGSAEPYADYTISGKYVDERTWEGTYLLNTLIENGNQYWNISGGCSATEDLELYADVARFGFVIDTTAAQALIMQGNATETGIQLTWTQDDFETLMGYNVYRSTSEDGYYQKLNSTVIPADVMEFFDDTVEPGVQYYYNFTVVKTDLTESEPSGKITIMSMDTMAPNIYHTPTYNAFTGENLIISATVTDNLLISHAKVYFRTVGESEWKSVTMTNNNSKYSAIIPAEYVTTAGIEYYIEAFDGISYTYKGSADAPYLVTVQEALDASALGDVNGDGVITNLDALLLLYAINDKYNMTAEEFARADLNGDGVLTAAEALRILQYVSGMVGSVIMP